MCCHGKNWDTSSGNSIANSSDKEIIGYFESDPETRMNDFTNTDIHSGSSRLPKKPVYKVFCLENSLIKHFLKISIQGHEIFPCLNLARIWRSEHLIWLSLYTTTRQLKFRKKQLRV